MVKSRKVHQKAKKLKLSGKKDNVIKNVAVNSHNVSRNKEKSLTVKGAELSVGELETEYFEDHNKSTDEEIDISEMKKPKLKMKKKFESSLKLPNTNEEDSKISDVENSFSNADDQSIDSESDISDCESNNSVSSFNIDSYPSDSDDGEEKDLKYGIPFNAVPSTELDERESRTVFVGNIPNTIERQELKKWFSRFGKVDCVRLRSAPIADLELPRKIAVIKKSFHQSRTNIHAYIRFKNAESAMNALQANGVRYGEHTLRIDSAKHEGGYDAKKAVFIGNVPFSIEEESLISLFSKCGEIEGVRVIRDKETGVGKGFAYINFKCSSSVALALKLDGEMLEKRPLRVKSVKYNRKQKLLPKFQSKLNVSKFNSGKFVSRKGQVKEEHGGRKSRTSFQKGVQHKSEFNTSISNPKHRSFKKPELQQNKFQGELSKRRERKQFKRKSFLTKKREMFSKIFTNKKKE